MIHISGRTYELIHENKNGWNIEAFRERFSDVLERYDYVVGDWGYNQLRLKGFFRDNHPKVTRDSAFSSMVDYINEYCNFGCAYFVLHKQPSLKQGEDGETFSDDDEMEPSAPREGTEEIYETGPSRTAIAGEGEEGAQEYQQVKFLPRHQRDQRREFHHKHGRKDAPKDADKDKDQPVKEGRKPFNKDRDKGSHKQQNAGGGNNPQQERANMDRSDRGDRGERPERNRAKRQHFSNAVKAPVAATSEIGAQPGQQVKDQGPKA